MRSNTSKSTCVVLKTVWSSWPDLHSNVTTSWLLVTIMISLCYQSTNRNMTRYYLFRVAVVTYPGKQIKFSRGRNSYSAFNCYFNDGDVRSSLKWRTHSKFRHYFVLSVTVSLFKIISTTVKHTYTTLYCKYSYVAHISYNIHMFSAFML
jgi:hypothetical protein